MAGRWVDVGEAARELDISTDAVRKRIARGSLEASREDGRILVWLDVGKAESKREAQVDRDAIVRDLREQVRYLREVLNEERDARRRADTIIEQLTQAYAALAAREPEVEAPLEPQGGPESVVESPEIENPTPLPRAEEPPDTAEWPVRGGLHRPWWRRVFGG